MEHQVTRIAAQQLPIVLAHVTCFIMAILGTVVPPRTNLPTLHLASLSGNRTFSVFLFIFVNDVVWNFK